MYPAGLTFGLTQWFRLIPGWKLQSPIPKHYLVILATLPGIPQPLVAPLGFDGKYTVGAHHQMVNVEAVGLNIMKNLLTHPLQTQQLGSGCQLGDITEPIAI